MNRIQIKDRRMGTYEINKILLPCLMTKYLLQTMGMMDYLLNIRDN